MATVIELNIEIEELIEKAYEVRTMIGYIGTTKVHVGNQEIDVVKAKTDVFKEDYATLKKELQTLATGLSDV